MARKKQKKASKDNETVTLNKSDLNESVASTKSEASSKSEESENVFMNKSEDCEDIALKSIDSDVAISKMEFEKWQKKACERTTHLSQERLHHTVRGCLMKNIKSCSSRVLLFKKEIDGVECTHDLLKDHINMKPCMRSFTFCLKSTKRLKSVCLLNMISSSHFLLASIVEKLSGQSYTIYDTQEYYNNDNTIRSNYEYELVVEFGTAVYGSFLQEVVFDFGQTPYLTREIVVNVMANGVFREWALTQSKLLRVDDAWNEEICDIVKLPSDDPRSILLEIYPLQVHNNVVPLDVVGRLHVDINDYKKSYHNLLYMEEIARMKLLHRYNIQSTISIQCGYIVSAAASSTMHFPAPGDKIGMLELCENVSEDTSYGRLILSCVSILISKLEVEGKRKCFEVSIKNITKSEVIINLSPDVLAEFAKDGATSFDCLVQFQLNRIPFCEMHEAVDRISIFGSLCRPNKDYNEQYYIREQLVNTLNNISLNEGQLAALEISASERTSTPVPPIVINGPYGTGKTFTLAHIISQILKERGSKVLVCTHSNSAADIYVREYLHNFYTNGQKNNKPLRIFYEKRWKETVDPITLKYSLTDSVKPDCFFRYPTKEEVDAHSIIVTTINTASFLFNIGIDKGYFTHILIDEAAQIMELEAYIPLSFAIKSTRIIFAGDHMQLGPEVFSDECIWKNMHVSILERLYNYYPPEHPCRITLVNNYRSHPQINEFMSEVFYDSELKSVSKEQKIETLKHSLYAPLTFFTAKGIDIQDTYSSSYHNIAEAYEVVDRIHRIVTSWPESWGCFNKASIGVISPYVDHNRRIRHLLKKNKQLSNISVERIQNVQGKEYSVVIISTVRTRNTCQLNQTDRDYGFLSNYKLFTTAITRAKYLVAVVGDPTSLCTFGRCQDVWHDYLVKCANLGSLHGMTIQSLKSDLFAVECQRIYGLNPLADEFYPKSYSYAYLQPQSSKPTYVEACTQTNFVQSPASSIVVSASNQSDMLTTSSTNQTNFNDQFNQSNMMYQSGINLNSQINPSEALLSASNPLNSKISQSEMPYQMSNALNPQISQSVIHQLLNNPMNSRINQSNVPVANNVLNSSQRQAALQQLLNPRINPSLTNTINALRNQMDTRQQTNPNMRINQANVIHPSASSRIGQTNVRQYPRTASNSLNSQIHLSNMAPTSNTTLNQFQQEQDKLSSIWKPSPQSQQLTNSLINLSLNQGMEQKLEAQHVLSNSLPVTHHNSAMPVAHNSLSVGQHVAGNSLPQHVSNNAQQNSLPGAANSLPQFRVVNNVVYAQPSAENRLSNLPSSLIALPSQRNALSNRSNTFPGVNQQIPLPNPRSYSPMNNQLPHFNLQSPNKPQINEHLPYSNLQSPNVIKPSVNNHLPQGNNHLAQGNVSEINSSSLSSQFPFSNLPSSSKGMRPSINNQLSQEFSNSSLNNQFPYSNLQSSSRPQVNNHVPQSNLQTSELNPLSGQYSQSNTNRSSPVRNDQTSLLNLLLSAGFLEQNNTPKHGNGTHY